MFTSVLQHQQHLHKEKIGELQQHLDLQLQSARIFFNGQAQKLQHQNQEDRQYYHTQVNITQMASNTACHALR
jgi:hypothetical protein